MNVVFSLSSIKNYWELECLLNTKRKLWSNIIYRNYGYKYYYYYCMDQECVFYFVLFFRKFYLL